MLQVIGGVVSDDVDDRAMGAPCVVKVREAVRETGAGMQQGCRRPSRHSRITVGGAGDHALEQTEHATHRGLSIQRGDKMHLGGAGVGEADIDTVGEKYVAQPISAVHALPPRISCLYRTTSCEPYSDSTRVGGIVTVTTVPSPRALLIESVARLASTSALVSGRPRPVPAGPPIVVVES